jgi:hypothetical protein
MNNIGIVQEKQKLDALIALISQINNDEMKAHWARYLCVLISGFIENSIKLLLREHTGRRAQQDVSSFVNNKLSRITNLNETKIKELLGAFNDSWREDFEQNISGEQKGAIDSVLANRHNIVHGRQVGVSFISVKTYYENIIKTLDYIENLVNS